MTRIKVAAVQATPVFLDRDATVEKTCRLLKEVGAAGAVLAVFPETFIPTYPDWVWRSTPWSRGHKWYRRLLEESVVVPSAATEAIEAAAREAGVWAAIGVDERDPNGGTVYNTLLYVSPADGVVAKHRKLMPTGGERLVWGMGDGSDLAVVDTPFGRVGGLICWENYMPLARFAMYAQGIDVWVAPTWDNSDAWIATLRHIAREGRVFVIGVSPCLRASDVPPDVPARDDLYGGEDDWMSRGNATIVAPDGTIVAGPLIGEEGILYAEIEVDDARASRVEFDPVGHYARPDVFRLVVNAQPKPPVAFDG